MKQLKQNVAKQHEYKEGGITGKGFVKGKSGNPNGRPKRPECIAEILRGIGDEFVEDARTGKKMSKLEYMLRQVYAAAGKGNMYAINFIADRTEGKAIERVLTQEVYDEIIIE
jgi:hypothetical protein